MEKHVAKWSYFGGVAGVVVTVAWRLLTLVGVMPKDLTQGSHPLTYDTLLKGALMLLAITIATGAYVLTQQSKA
jgi:hypothetical protein